MGYVAKVIEVHDTYAKLSYMSRKEAVAGTSNKFVRSEREDTATCSYQDILKIVQEPVPLSSRFHGLSSKDLSELQDILLVNGIFTV